MLCGGRRGIVLVSESELVVIEERLMRWMREVRELRMDIDELVEELKEGGD